VVEISNASKMKKKRYRHQQILGALIQTAYLPAEIPPVVTARHFADYARAEFKNLKKLKASTKTLQTPTLYDRYNIPRENGTRRDLALVHPRSQLNLSMILTERHQLIRQIITDMKVSRYRADADLKNFKAFKGISFSNLDRARAEIARRKAWILSADISRFFYTIYTHSIPWAVLGKDKVKQTLFGGKKTKKISHWTGEIDAALQNCQSRETFGIPVGPDTSRIVAEILLSGIHSDLTFSTILKNGTGYRLVDDFFLGFDSERECQDALAALSNALSQFNLQLNDEKTSIRSATDIFMERWRFELIGASISIHDEQRQMRDIRKVSELALYHASQIGNSHPIKWITQKLSNLKYFDRNFGLLLTTLLRFGRDFPVVMNLVCVFIINNKSKCKGFIAQSHIKSWVRAIFAARSRDSHDFEITWALVVCGALNIRVSRSDFGNYLPSICSVAFALLGLLDSRGLLVEPLSAFRWRPQVKNGGLDGHHWLMFYESVLRGWTKDSLMISAVKSDALFGDLFAKNVSFLNDTIFGDVRVDLDQRRMKRLNLSQIVAISDETTFGLSSL
jgi:hypothetical protein